MRKAQIEVFDSLGNKLALVENYTDLSFERNLHTPGNFIISMKLYSKPSSFFAVDYMIRINQDNSKCGVIHSVDKLIDSSGKGGASLVIRGQELWAILSRRIVTTGTGSVNYESNDKAETVMKTLIKSQIGSTASANRIWTGLTVATDGARGDNYIVSAFGTNLLDEISRAAMSSGIGVYAYLTSAAPAQITIDTIHGLDRRTSQSTNAHALFSTDIGTVKETSFSHNKSALKNLVYVGGQGENALRVVRTVYDTTEPTGKDRREAYKDQRDQNTNAKLDQSGADILAANVTELYIGAKALEFSKLKYQTDFDLGDLVTIKDFDLTQDGRVISVVESWVAGQYNIDVAFDKEKPRFDKQVAAQILSANQVIGAIPATVEASAATASTVVKRDSSGRTKMAAPSASDDVAIYSTVLAGGVPIGYTYEQKPGTKTPASMWPASYTWVDISSRAHTYGLSAVNSGDPTSTALRGDCNQSELFTDTDYSIGDQIAAGANINKYVRGIATFAGVFSRISGGNSNTFGGGNQLDQLQGHYHAQLAPVTAGSASLWSYSLWTTSRDASLQGVDTTFQSIGSPTDDGTNGTPRTGTETRPVNITVKLWIRQA